MQGRKRFVPFGAAADAHLVTTRDGLVLAPRGDAGPRTTALRAVDHVSFVLSGNTDVRLTLFHVTSRASDYCEINFGETPSPELEEIVRQQDQVCIDQFYTQALQKFKNSGFSEDQLETTTVKGGGNTGKIILEAAEKGNFSTLVIGRKGIDKAFFMGKRGEQS